MLTATPRPFLLWLRWTLAMTAGWPLGYLATELSRFAKDLVLLPEEVPLIPIFLAWSAFTLVLGGVVMWLPNALVMRHHLPLRPWFIAASLCLILAVIEIALRTVVGFLLPQISDAFTYGPEGRGQSGSFGVGSGENFFFDLYVVGCVFAGIAFWLLYRFPFYWGVAVIVGGWLAHAAAWAVSSSSPAFWGMINAGIDGYGIGLPMFVVGGLVFGVVTGLAIMLMNARSPQPSPVAAQSARHV